MGILATTEPPVVGSVVFELTRNGVPELTRTENIAPYALFGDADDGMDILPWPDGPLSGSTYQLSMTAYSGSNGSGVADPPLVISFSATTACSIDDDCDDQLFCNGMETCLAGACVPGMIQCAGTEVCDEPTDSCLPAPTEGVVSLTLMNTDSDLPVPGFDPLLNGAAFNVTALPNISIGANTSPEVVGSVLFVLKKDGVVIHTHTENTPPYALFGDDNNGGFYPWVAGPVVDSIYEVTATAFSGVGGSGTAYPSLIVGFSVTDFCSVDSDCENGAYCDGVESCVAGACVGGTPPCAGNEACSDATETCTVLIPQTYYVDDDGADQPGYDAAAPLGSVAHPFESPQTAADIVNPGDTVILRAGTYESGSTAQGDAVLTMWRSGAAGFPITFRAASGEGVVFSGQSGITRVLISVEAVHIDLEDFELTNARRVAIDVVGPGASYVNIRRCHAHHNNFDLNFIGGAIRVAGPAQHVVIESCISHNNSSGFMLRESPTRTASQAAVPPRAGNIGFLEDLPEEEWDDWPGWTTIAPRFVTIRNCIAFDNALIDEHSDGIASRYGIESVFENNIVFGNTDDGLDILGGVRCTISGNIAFNNDPLDTPNGDGNGIKIGVRGGLDHIVHHNISFGNPRGGIDLADTERAVVVNNTAFNNRDWFGMWFEGNRSAIGLTVVNNISRGNTKGDIGVIPALPTNFVDNNLVSDANDHPWAIPLGPASHVSTDPLFLDEASVIDTAFPAGLTVSEKLSFIRAQVYAKLGLAPGSPAIDAGTQWPGLTIEFGGTAPDIGAHESP